jgi:hypothetical protein
MQIIGFTFPLNVEIAGFLSVIFKDENEKYYMWASASKSRSLISSFVEIDSLELELFTNLDMYLVCQFPPNLLKHHFKIGDPTVFAFYDSVEIQLGNLESLKLAVSKKTAVTSRLRRINAEFALTELIEFCGGHFLESLEAAVSIENNSALKPSKKTPARHVFFPSLSPTNYRVPIKTAESIN